MYLQTINTTPNLDTSFQMSFRKWNINPHPDPDVQTYPVPIFLVNKLPVKSAFFDLEEDNVVIL